MTTEFASRNATKTNEPPSRHVRKLITLISLGGRFEFYDLFFTAYIAVAAASSKTMNGTSGFAQAGNRYPLFGIML